PRHRGGRRRRVRDRDLLTGPPRRVTRRGAQLHPTRPRRPHHGGSRLRHPPIRENGSHLMTDHFFADIDAIRYAGPDTDDPLAFRWYDADRVVQGRTMRDHLRFAVCYWHSFNWDGFDIFGDGTLDRPWLDR